MGADADVSCTHWVVGETLVGEESELSEGERRMFVIDFEAKRDQADLDFDLESWDLSGRCLELLPELGDASVGSDRVGEPT
jgi:hypothetical protein